MVIFNALSAEVTVDDSTTNAPVHPEFAFSDGKIELQTTDFVFWLHEFQLSKFKLLSNEIREAREQAIAIAASLDYRTKLKVRGQSADFANTFRIMYASIVPSAYSLQFDSKTFISALRIATYHDYPDLREFAISKLRGFTLPTMERLQLADELTIPEWESMALSELCYRTEPISQDEAKILGVDRVLEISHRREKEHHRRFRDNRHFEYFSMIFRPNPWIFAPFALWIFCTLMSFITKYMIELTYAVCEGAEIVSVQLYDELYLCGWELAETYESSYHSELPRYAYRMHRSHLQRMIKP
ncbi:unnamed protein product [Rhizoctonia solani]|uniref:Uncharacterized protein n=1 Tax=Rhizoctonia solani TaxID=456999 RepID=A0A8H2XIC5_9AGAM|nr:unnamed protein product [Rhizoctonia solani]